MRVTVNMVSDGIGAPVVRVLDVEHLGRALALDASPEVGIILPGFGAPAARFALLLAEALTRAAGEIAPVVADPVPQPLGAAVADGPLFLDEPAPDPASVAGSAIVGDDDIRF